VYISVYFTHLFVLGTNGYESTSSGFRYVELLTINSMIQRSDNTTFTFPHTYKRSQSIGAPPPFQNGRLFTVANQIQILLKSTLLICYTASKCLRRQCEPYGSVGQSGTTANFLLQFNLSGPTVRYFVRSK
jgi:hypothetical protein